MFERAPRIPIRKRLLASLSALVAAMAVLAGTETLAAAVAPQAVRQFAHQRWTQESHPPTPIRALAQDRMGFVWLATDDGLFRFDGLRFEAIADHAFLAANGPPSAMVFRRNGDLLVAFERSQKFAVYRDGRLRLMSSPRAPSRITSLVEAPDGSVWALTESIDRPVLHLRNGKWSWLGRKVGIAPDNAFSLVITRDGSIWISFSSSIVRLPSGARTFETRIRQAYTLGRLSLDPAGRVWLSEVEGSYPISGPGGLGPPPPLRFAYPTSRPEIWGNVLFDPAGNLWVGTPYSGIERVDNADPRGAASPAQAKASVENLGEKDGIASNQIMAAMINREGNPWFGSDKGLDRFWPSSYHAEPALTDSAAFGDRLLAASDGSVYIAERKVVYRAAPNARPVPVLHGEDFPTTLCEAPDGAIWISRGLGVSVWKGGRQRLPSPPPVPSSSTLYDCAFDARGDYWLSAARGGLFHLVDGRWRKLPERAGSHPVPKSMVADPKGNFAIHWSRDRIAWLGSKGNAEVQLPFSPNEREDLTLYHSPSLGLVVMGKNDFVRFRDGRVSRISGDRAAPVLNANGIVEAPRGKIWIAGNRGIAEFRAEDIDRALNGRGPLKPRRVFGRSEGLTGQPHSHSRSSIVRGGDGRLWLAIQTGTVWLDPENAVRLPATPKPVIRYIVADGRLFRDPVKLDLQAMTSSIEIDFAAPSYTRPEATEVSYRLDGVESQWVPAGSRRQAFYTNLSPGTYTFQVRAANRDRAGESRTTSVQFDIPPTFVQSRQFIVLCAILLVGLLFMLFRIRSAQLVARMRSRLEERAAERERIARELHDTLLQGTQGLILRFQSIADRIPDNEPARQDIEATLARADEIMVEGRESVKNLRLADTSSDFAGTIASLIGSADFSRSTSATLVTEGRVRSVDPMAAAELQRICGEALANAARHAGATSVEVAVCFERKNLILAIQDDGMGISPEVLSHGGRDGHFGLVGMRERAERIGASFTIESGAGLGTLLKVSVPARLAYMEPQSGGWISRLLPKSWRTGHA